MTGKRPNEKTDDANDQQKKKVRFPPRSPLDDIPTTSGTQPRSASAGGDTSSQSMERVKKAQNLSRIIDRLRVEPATSNTLQMEEPPAQVSQVEPTSAQVPQVEPTPAQISRIEQTPAQAPQLGQAPAQPQQLGQNPVQDPQSGQNPVQDPQSGQNPSQDPQSGQSPSQDPQLGGLTNQVQESSGVSVDPEDSDVIPSLVIRFPPRSPFNDIPTTSGTQAGSVSAGGDTRTQINAIIDNMGILARSNRRLEEALSPNLSDETEVNVAESEEQLIPILCLRMREVPGEGPQVEEYFEVRASITEEEAEIEFGLLSEENFNLTLSVIRVRGEAEAARLSGNLAVHQNFASIGAGKGLIIDLAIIRHYEETFLAKTREANGYELKKRAMREAFAKKCAIGKKDKEAFIKGKQLPLSFDDFKKKYAVRFAIECITLSDEDDDVLPINENDENAQNDDNAQTANNNAKNTNKNA